METITARKVSYWVQGWVIDGVPQCRCCYEPMVERDGGWMCAMGSAMFDALAGSVEKFDRLFDAVTE